MAGCLEPYATPAGKRTMGKWKVASKDFNIAMPAGDQSRAFKDLHDADNCFDVAQHQMKNAALGRFLGQIHKEFSAKLETKDISAINNFMQAAMGRFQEALAKAKSN